MLNLPASEMWRLWGEHKKNALFLDIETTGLGQSAHVTVLGTYFRKKFRAFVHGKDLDQAWNYLNKASLLVTFNGRQFDVPFIERHFGERLDLPHIDLRFVAGSLGFKGGLKKIEPQFGIRREEEIGSINGFEAIKLWRRYERGDIQSLNRLVAYNQADVEGLPIIMEGCWLRKLETRNNFPAP